MSDQERPVTVDVTEAFPEAERVRVETLNVGDILFDVFGRQHPVEHIRLLKNDIRVSFGGDMEYLKRGTTIPVIRKGA